MMMVSVALASVATDHAAHSHHRRHRRRASARPPRMFWLWADLAGKLPEPAQESETDDAGYKAPVTPA